MDESEPVVPVVMSLWKRLPFLDRTLYQLSRQEGVRPEFYLLNNNPAIIGEVERLIRKYQGKLPIHLTQGDNSLACFSRFVHARQIKNGYPYLAMIDDDQEFNRRFLRTLWKERTPRGVTGCHARHIQKGRSYWHRLALKPGDRAEYCGPGGMLIDSTLLDRPELYRGPEQALIMDDLWFSYVMHNVVRAPMHQSSAKVRMTDSNNDTFLKIFHEKANFLDHLRAHGWDV